MIVDRKYHFLLVVALAVVALSALFSCSGKPHDGVEDMLRTYDKAVSRYGRAVRIVESRVDSMLADTAATAADSIALFSRISRAYADLSLDSAVVWCQRAADVAAATGSDSDYVRSRVELSRLLMLQGLATEAAMMFNSVPADSLSGVDLVGYHEVGRQIAITLFDLAKGRYSPGYFSRMAQEHSQALISMLPDTAVAYDFSMASLCKASGKETKQLPFLLGILARPDASAHAKSVASLWLGVYYLRTEGPVSENAGRYLMMSAIEELRSGRRTGYATGLLGQWFYDVGDRDRGMKAWRIAVDNSLASGLSNPWIKNQSLASSTFTVIDNKRRQWWITIALLSGMVLICCGIAVVAWRARSTQRRQLEKMERRLQDMTDSKRGFVKEFMRLFSLYMDGIEEQNRMVCRKLAAGHTEELLRQLRSGKFVADQGKIMYEGFDNAFLNVFPDFIDGLNDLLQPDKRFDIGDKRVLTPELRVMALQRLGIDDGQSVARFLGLSVNTVYAYRNKVRTRVADRDSFDREFMRIGTRLD